MHRVGYRARALLIDFLLRASRSLVEIAESLSPPDADRRDDLPLPVDPLTPEAKSLLVTESAPATTEPDGERYVEVSRRRRGR